MSYHFIKNDHKQYLYRELNDYLMYLMYDTVKMATSEKFRPIR